MELVKRPAKSARLEIQFNDDEKFIAWAKQVAKQYLEAIKRDN